MFERIRRRRERARYARAMIAALDRCRRDCISGHEVSRFWAARVIRDFERINGVKFDPFNGYHCSIIAGWGPHRKFMARQRDIMEGVGMLSQLERFEG